MQAPTISSDTQLTFGEWLKRRRKTLDLTREKLAWRVGCSFETIKKIESGDLKPSAQLAELLSVKLEVPASEREAFIKFARTDTTLDAFAFSGLPVASAGAPVTSTATSLPAPVTSLLGRGRELHVARELLEREDVRLLTLTGPPGAGKTRLALALATQLRQEFADGAAFVPLALVDDPALVIPAIAETFHVQELANEPLTLTLHKALGPKHALVVLDNFEQVIAASHLVSELLTAAPLVKIIVTSREALRVYGEQEFPVPPLELPDVKHLPPIEALAHYSAVALFVARARAVKPDFELTNANGASVARICALLDGLPLALEMAAVQIKRAPPARVQAQLEEKLVALGGGLRDLSPRQQTLRGALDWSYNLLNADEQHTLARLSVFVGGAEFQALARVLESENAAASAGLEDTLASLIDKNLARVREERASVRYTMLETIRGYAFEKLQAGGALEEVRTRYVNYFVELAEEIASAAPRADGSQYDPLEYEYENLRAALTWALEQTNAGSALRLCRALGGYWKLRGHWSEGLLWTRRALAHGAGAEANYQRLRADALLLAAQLAERQESQGGPRAMYQESLELRRALGDERAVAESLDALALFCFMHGEHDTARQYAQEALALARTFDDPSLTAHILNLLGRLELARVDHAAARVYLQESLMLSRAAADTTNTAGALYHMGNAAFVEGRYGDARRDLLEALRLDRTRGDVGAARRVLVSLGMCALGMDDFASAQEWLEESLRLAHTLNDRYGEAFSLHSLGMLTFWQGNLEEARRLLEASLEAARSIGANTGAGRMARTMLGMVELAEGNGEAAYATGTEVLAAWRAVHDREDEARALGILGYAALLRGDMAAAQEHFRQRLALARDLDKFPRLAEALFDSGYMAFKQNDTATAHALFRELVEAAHRTNSTSWRGLSLMGLALLAQPTDAVRATFLFHASSALLQTIPLNRGALPSIVRQDVIQAEAHARRNLNAETLARVWLDAKNASREQLMQYALNNSI